VGASGDLAALAHLALVVIGEGEAFYKGERMAAARRCGGRGCGRLHWLAKEGWRC